MPANDTGYWVSGDIKMTALVNDTLSTKCQPGWLICDGSAENRAGDNVSTGFPALFEAIGERYGAGDGTTTFNLPDFQGRSPMGAGGGIGLTARDLGDRPGEESGNIQVSTVPALTVNVNEGEGHFHPPLSGSDYILTNAGIAAATIGTTGFTIGNTALSTTGITATTPSPTPTNQTNMQPSVVVNFLIKK